MSKFKIETEKTIEIDGVPYSTDIDKEVEINFASAQYSVKESDTDDDRIELVPDNMEFLHEVTEIFPLSEYEIKIIQYIFGQRQRRKEYVCINISIHNKKTGKQIYLPESVILSDADYDYLKKILEEALPEYEWMTLKEHLIRNMQACLSENNMDELFTYSAVEYLGKLIGKEYDDIKTKGYDDFDFEDLKKHAARIVAEALCEAYERNK